MTQTTITDTLRQSVISVLGAPPDPAPLLPQVLDVTAETGYRREHIRYQVSPNDWGYAYLLLPDRIQTAVPVIYCHHANLGDFRVGKDEVVGLAGDRRHAIGPELARMGFAVFAPDAIGYGERRSAHSDGHSYDAAYTQHQHALLLLRGETLLRKIIWDVSKGIDYLETRSEIDSRYVGFLGHNYGGKVALWAAALEPRITAAAAHGGIITYRENLRRGQWFQIEFVVPRLMQVADMHHILSLIAPRPFLISTIAGDTHSADAEEIYQRAQPSYQKFGAGHRLSLYRYPGGNGFEPNMRFNVYTWFSSWLMPY